MVSLSEMSTEVLAASNKFYRRLVTDSQLPLPKSIIDFEVS